MMQQDATAIVQRGREAQLSWARHSVSQRRAVLARLRRVIAIKCESIAELIAREVSKPLLDALSGDVMVTLEMLRYYESHGGAILRARRIRKPLFFFSGARFERHLEPYGVALIFAPSNYPFQLSMVPTITALITGNAVVLKCSEKTPETAELISSLCEQAGLPDGLVQVMHVKTREAAELIDARPDVIFFTGSSRHGELVAERAARLLIPAILELGGKDAALVFADCHLARAVEGIAYGSFSNSGRVCVGAKRVYIEKSIYGEFIDSLRARVAALRVSGDMDADFLPLSSSEHGELREQVADALARGASLVYPGSLREIGDRPALLTGVPAESHILTHECFGPVLCVAAFSNETEALALANESAFALSSSIWTRDIVRARRIAARLSSGSCAINDVVRVIANPHAPFGGNRRSGYGRYHGPEGLLAFSRTKTMMLADDRREREIHWFPFSTRTRTRLAKLVRFRHGSIGITGWLGRLLPLLLAGALLAQAQPQSPPQTQLSIRVHLTPQAHGELAYLIFNSPSGFPGDRDKALRHGFATITPDAKQLLVQADLPPGLYAVSMYEDENGNRKLDHNLIGIPREPVGASNNPRPRIGPPHFSECTFRVGPSPQTIEINMVQGL